MSEISVLHVDDNEPFRKITRDLLTELGNDLQVQSAESGQEGLDVLESENIDVIVSDFEMPGLSGIEFLQRVRNKFGNIPFILFTAEGSEEVASEAISAGVTDYISKGAGSDKFNILINRIKNTVSGHKAKQRVQQQARAMDCASEGLAIIDIDGQYVEINDTYANMHNTTVGDLTGQHFSETLTAESEAALKQSLQDAESGDELSHSCIAQRASGERFSKQLSLNVLEDGLTVAVARDASDKPDTTDYAVDDAPTHEELLHTVGDVLYAFDSQGNFSFVNKTFCEVMAVEPCDILGAHFSEITAKVDIPEAEAAFKNVASDETDTIQATYQKRIKTGDSDWLPVETHMKRLPGDEFRGVVGVVRNVSQRKERSETLEQRTKELDEVTSFISHNMKSPLTGLSGYLHAISTDDTELKKAAIDSVQRIEEMVTSVSSLTAEDWDVTHTEELSLQEVAQEAWSHVSGGGEMTLQNNFDSDDTVEANRTKLMSLFENLFTNAVDHCSAPNVTVTATQLGFKISDNGPGIPEKKRDDIFRSGFSDGDSTGIGLAHSQKIVAAHDWTVTVEESESGGTTFRIKTEAKQFTTPESQSTASSD